MEMVKQNNRSSILKLINSTGSMSRKDIAQKLKLTPAAVTLMCADLLEEGVLVEKGEQQEEKRAGRKKILVDINYTFRYALAINIESDYTYLTISDLKGNAVKARRITTDNNISPEEYLVHIANESKILMWEAGVDKKNLLGAGIGITGIVDSQNGISTHAYGIWKQNIEIKKIMEHLLELPVIIENNVKAFAMGELVYGVGREKDNLLFVKWGPGVGSAIVIQNQLYEGKDNKAAEIGHYIVEPEGIECRCGRKGCLETRVSYRAILGEVKKVFSKEKTPALYKELGGDISKLTNGNIELLAKLQDGPIKQILENSIRQLAEVIVNVITVLSPNRVIIYGIPLEIQSIRESFILNCKQYDKAYDEKYITNSKLGGKINYIGPAALVVNKLFLEMGGK